MLGPGDILALVSNQAHMHVFTPHSHTCVTLVCFPAVRRYVAATQTVERVAGTGEQGDAGEGGPAVDAVLNQPAGVRVAPNGVRLPMLLDRLTSLTT